MKAEKPTTERAPSLGPGLRLAPGPAEQSIPESADPFAGDDDPWAPEDLAAAWVEDAQSGADASVGFFRALLIAMAISAVGWAAIGGAAFALYQLLTG